MVRLRKLFSGGRSTGRDMIRLRFFNAVIDCCRRESMPATKARGAIVRPVRIEHAIRAPMVISPSAIR